MIAERHLFAVDGLKPCILACCLHRRRGWDAKRLMSTVESGLSFGIAHGDIARPPFRLTAITNNSLNFRYSISELSRDFSRLDWAAQRRSNPSSLALSRERERCLLYDLTKHPNKVSVRRFRFSFAQFISSSYRLNPGVVVPF
jgi:hypothetical protein